MNSNRKRPHEESSEPNGSHRRARFEEHPRPSESNNRNTDGNFAGTSSALWKRCAEPEQEFLNASNAPALNAVMLMKRRNGIYLPPPRRQILGPTKTVSTCVVRPFNREVVTIKHRLLPERTYVLSFPFDSWFNTPQTPNNTAPR